MSEKSEKTLVAVSTMDVKPWSLPSETITREEYMRQGGMVVKAAKALDERGRVGTWAGKPMLDLQPSEASEPQSEPSQ